MHLLQNLDRGRTLDDEGIRKLVAQLYFVSPEEREIAKEQTDVRIWCRMVFAGIRATEARNIKGTKIGPRDIREWDAIPVKTVSPVRFCISGSKIVLIKFWISVPSAPRVDGPASTLALQNKNGAENACFGKQDVLLLVVIPNLHRKALGEGKRVISERKGGEAPIRPERKRITLTWRFNTLKIARHAL